MIQASISEVNMENISEDIKILEEFINNYKEVQEKYKDDEIQAEIERSCYFEEVPAQALEHLIKAYKELEYKYNKALSDLVQAEHKNKELKQRQIIKNEQIRNGQPVIANTRLTVLDILYLITEFIKRHEEEFRKDYADISINQIISAIDYFIDNSISVSLIEEKIEELKQEGNYMTIENPNGRIHFRAEPCDFKIQVLEELLEKRK